MDAEIYPHFNPHLAIAEEPEPAPELVLCPECGRDVAAEGHHGDCTRQEGYLGHCDDCFHVMLQDNEAEDNHYQYCMQYPGNYLCDECENVVNRNDDYTHQEWCSYHPTSWECEYCGQRFAEHEDHDCEAAGDEEEDEEDDDYVPADEPPLPPMPPQPLEQQRMTYTIRGTHTMTDEELERLRWNGEYVGCGDRKCLECAKLSLMIRDYNELEELRSRRAEQPASLPWGKSPYKKGDYVFIIYDRDQPWAAIVKDVVQEDERFRSGVGITLQNDLNETMYDLMWVMPDEATAKQAQVRFLADPHEWARPGVALEVITAALRKGMGRDNDILKYSPYRTGDVVWVVDSQGVTEAQVGRVSNGRWNGDFLYELNIPGLEGTKQSNYASWAVWQLCPTHEEALKEFERIRALPDDERLTAYPYNNYNGSLREVRFVHSEMAARGRVERQIEKNRAYHEGSGGDKPVAPQKSSTEVSGVGVLGKDTVVITVLGTDVRVTLPPEVFTDQEIQAVLRHEQDAPLMQGQPVMVAYIMGGGGNIEYATPNPTRVLSCTPSNNHVSGWEVRVVGHNETFDPVWLFDTFGGFAAYAVVPERFANRNHITMPMQQGMEDIMDRAARYEDEGRNMLLRDGDDPLIHWQLDGYELSEIVKEKLRHLCRLYRATNNGAAY